MGIYLNPGAKALQQSRKSEIYVDKSMLLAYLNRVIDTERRYVCVSRPRRFGKTMAANMVCAYYDHTVDGAKEFAGLAISDDPSFEVNRNSYDVIRINMQQFLSAAHDMGELVELLASSLAFDLSLAYPDMRFRDTSSVPGMLMDAYAQTGRQFVVVVDEWDCPMRELVDDHDQQEAYLDFLRSWLKDQPCVALCYMTGILPVKKYGTHSALNMFSEFSMTSPLQMAPFMGFTGEEVRELCKGWGRDFEECRSWYDGYLLAVDGGNVEIYSPKSVVEAMISGSFESFWNRTETYDALRRYIELDFFGLHDKVVRLISGERVAVNVATYVNDMSTFRSADDVLTLLVHLGYLGYDTQTGTAFIPNREVLGEYANSIESDAGWTEVVRSIRESERLLEALVHGDEGQVALGVERAHEDASSIIAYNDENSLACTLRLAFFSAIRRWRVVREAPAGKGFADMVLVPLASSPATTPGVVIQLKYGATADAALSQVRERGYARVLEGLALGRDVILCGIAYDPKTKRHSCRIERVQA